MACKVENMTNGKLVIRLSSGEFLHLAPRATSVELNDVEVKNDKVEKLLDRRAIAIHASGKGSSSKSSG